MIRKVATTAISNRIIPKHINSKTFKSFQQHPIISFTNMSTVSASEVKFPVEAAIASKLNDALEPSVLNVINESHMHNVPKNSETHFKVVVVSAKFNDVKSLVKRHRMVNSILAEEIATEGPVHALSIVAKTPSQWEKMIEKSNGEVVIGSSPSCRGGDGSLPKR